MLRQIFILKDSEIIYRHFYANALSTEEIGAVIKKLGDYIRAPEPGKVFTRPMMDYQIAFGSINGLFYILVADTTDRPKNISDATAELADFISSSASEGGFSDPIGYLRSDGAKEELAGFLKELHYKLHPKIVLIGPMGAGKSSIYDLLTDKNADERKIMTFARVKPCEIGGLTFDLWDFIMPDDFSPLWNNFIRGSDLVIMVFNAAAPAEQKIIHFINLYKREARFSRGIVFLSHASGPDAMDPDKFTENFGELLPDIPVISFDLETDEDVKDILINGIANVLDFRKPLPPEFKELLIKANNEIGNEDYAGAVADLQKLIEIAEEYGEEEYAETFRKKIDELKRKMEELEEKKKKERKKIPEKKVFTKKISVKKLPIKASKPAEKPATVSPAVAGKKLIPERTAENLNKEALLLQSEIKKFGGSMPLPLCVKFIEQMHKRLGKESLTPEEISNAACLYVEKLKSKKKSG